MLAIAAPDSSHPAAQTAAPGDASAALKGRSRFVPRTPDGRPDLQGVCIHPRLRCRPGDGVRTGPRARPGEEAVVSRDEEESRYDDITLRFRGRESVAA